MSRTMTATAAAVYDRDGSIRVREVPLAPPASGELLVRITACGICPSETLRWYVERKAPFVLGHEPVGVVEACGAGVDAFRPGERVFVHHHAPCMSCRRCLRGDYVQCKTWRERGLYPGGMAQRALVRAPIVRADVLGLPDSLSDDATTFIEPLATVVKSTRRAGIRAGDRVLVIGLGVMGLMHVMLAKSAGAEVIIGADPIASRRKKALEFGAHHAFEPAELPNGVLAATGDEGADAVIVGPGSIDAMDAGASCVARGGRIVLFTPLPPEEQWPIPVHDFFFKDVTVVASYSAGPDDMREALHLLAGGLPVESLITHRYGLQDVQAGYRLVADAGEALKVIVYPDR